MEKSAQKFKKPHTTDTNRGINTKVASNCPPDMTDSIKKALLKEIKEFNAVQAKKDIEESAEGKASVNAYHDWLEHNEGHELPEANPDILAEDEGIRYLTSKKDSESARLLKEFRQTLTARELQVWNLIMHHQYSYRDTAKLLKIHASTVRDKLKNAKIKFITYAEAIKRVEKE